MSQSVLANNTILLSNETDHSILSDWMRTSLCIYYSFVIVASLVCNVTLISIIAKLKKLHTISHLFIVNLAISNLLTSVIYLPFDVEEMVRGQGVHGKLFVHGKILCGIYKLSFMLSLPLSIINLLLLTIETFITIAFPYKRYRFIKPRNVAICLAVAYSYAILFTLFPVFRQPYTAIQINQSCYIDTSNLYLYFFVVMNLFIPLCIIVVLNVWIFRIANKQAKKIQSFKIMVNEQASEVLTAGTESIGRSRSSSPSNIGDDELKYTTASNNNLRRVHSDERRRSCLPNVRSRRMFTLNIKAAKRIALLVGVCLFCWLFYDIIVLRNVAGYYSETITRVGNVINYSSLFLNPLVYGMYNPQIRRLLFKTSCYYVCFCRHHNSGDVYNTRASTVVTSNTGLTAPTGMAALDAEMRMNSLGSVYNTNVD